ncbi:hypothetical protein FHW96_002038 [Novosphingobium sp. SG751A]|nr:hypothetical protein [Novosphingobium sp. SG751A]
MSFARAKLAALNRFAFLISKGWGDKFRLGVDKEE